ncbi:MAG TPA: TonB-dependent receptor [Gammaproteobacteria bacterium]
MNRLSLVLPVAAGLCFSFCPNVHADDSPAPAASTRVAAPTATTTPAVEGVAAAPAAATTVAPAAGTATAQLGDITVESRRLNRARDSLNPETGTTSYHFDTQTLASMPEGADTPLQEVLLQAPGVAQDSFGQLHVRGDHADIQYRINGIIIPEFISGFGDTLGSRFISKLDFLTGALPAQYGYRTAGIVNITTYQGADLDGGSVDLYGGSHGTFQPSVEYGGSDGALDYYGTGTYLKSDLGIESPTAANPGHDETEQARGFGYLSYVLNPDMRLGLMLGHSLGNFQLPDNPDQQPNFELNGQTRFDSADVNETQRELNDYAIASLQVSQDKLGYQVALFTRYSSVQFNPDPVADLLFNGVAAQVYRRNIATGLQADASYALDAAHTLRWGGFADQERTSSDNTAAVFPADANGSQTSDVPETIVDDGGITGHLYGAYLQDEWQVSAPLVVNYGLRYDISEGYVDEHQWSPRLNFVYTLDEADKLHGGFSRYFTPPTLELIAPTDIAKFQGTTNALPSNVNTSVSAERDSYYDLGWTHSFTPAWQAGLDGYYKDAKNLLDEGQFGQALVFSPFNYARGRVWGIEFTTSYTGDLAAAYFNLAYGRALGNQVVSGQYNFDPAELAYIQDHYVHLDHDQTWTASGGISHVWAGTRFSLDGVFGSGLRAGFANTGSLPSYAQFDVAATRSVQLGGFGELGVRLAIVNLLDRIYEIRDGSGIGVGAPQYGPRRGFYLGLTKTF